jgi:hypothetical protein
MLTFYNKYQQPGRYSQNGEWGIILECLDRIQPDRYWAVEFGAPDFYYCSNIAQLEDFGWTLQVFDIDPRDPRVIRAEITPENVNTVFDDTIYRGSPTILSIDIDGQDYHIWKAYKGNPAIVVIEINSSFAPGVDMIPGDRGASYTAMVKLGIEKGYMLIAHTGNLVFVEKSYAHLFPEFTWADPLTSPALYFNRKWL